MFDIEVTTPSGAQKKNVDSARVYQLSGPARVAALKGQFFAQKQFTSLLGATAYVDQASMQSTSEAAATKRKN